jgi:PAS domain S-box-containing protein
MPKKPTYEELEQRNKELEKEAAHWKRIEEELRKSEKPFKSVTNSIEDIIVLLDQNFKVRFINTALAQTFNISLDEYKGKHCYELLLGRNNICEDCPAIKVLNDGKANSDLRYRPDGHIIRRAVYPMIEDNSEITGAVIVGVDITEQKQTEAKLRESKEKYRSMMEAMVEPAYICSSDFIVSYMNPAMVERTGRDATGELCYKAINDLDEQCPWCVHDKIQNGESDETIIVSPKDYRLYSISRAPIFHNDGSISKMTIYRDITDLKRAEEALKRSEEKYRLLVESTPNWVWMCDLKSRITFSNNSVKEILGYEIHEILGTSALSLMHDADRKAVQKWFQKAIKQKRGWRGSVISWQHKDKSIKFLETIAEPIFDDKGNLIGYSGIDRDVTDRKLSEIALQKAHYELQEKTIRLEDKKKSLEEINTAIKVLLKKREEDKIEIEKNVLTNVK